MIRSVKRDLSARCTKGPLPSGGHKLNLKCVAVKKYLTKMSTKVLLKLRHVIYSSYQQPNMEP